MVLLPKSLIEKRFVDFRFFLGPQRGKMLIEITVDQGALRRCAIVNQYQYLNDNR